MVCEETAGVCERSSALFDGCYDGGEVVIQQHEIRCLTRDVGTGLAHRNSDVSLLQRRTVVNPIASHGNDMTAPLQGSGDPQFVLRCDPAQHNSVTINQRTQDCIVRWKVVPFDD